MDKQCDNSEKQLVKQVCVRRSYSIINVTRDCNMQQHLRIKHPNFSYSLLIDIALQLFVYCDFVVFTFYQLYINVTRIFPSRAVAYKSVLRDNVPDAFITNGS
jgi:hypothetical protein